MGDFPARPLTEAALEQIRALPVNELAASATSTDFRTIDARLAVRRTWANGWGAGAFLAAKLGTGRPQGSAGVEVTKKLGLFGIGRKPAMNPMYRAMIGGVVRVIAPFLVSQGLDLDNDKLEHTIETLVLVGSVVWSLIQKRRVDRKIAKAAATGLK